MPGRGHDLYGEPRPSRPGLPDGLYAVVHDAPPRSFVAAFVVSGGVIVEAAPILRRRLRDDPGYWIHRARYVCP